MPQDYSDAPYVLATKERNKTAPDDGNRSRIVVEGIDEPKKAPHDAHDRIAISEDEVMRRSPGLTRAFPNLYPEQVKKT
jgi:hypothetical protein